MKKYLYYTLAVLVLLGTTNIQLAFANEEETDKGQQEDGRGPSEDPELNPWDPRGN